MGDYNLDRVASGEISATDLRGVVKLAQEKLGIAADGLCGPVTLAEVRKLAPAKANPPTQFIDRRSYHTPCIHGNKYTPLPRSWSQVKGITLHQTACDMGERVERYDTIGAHFAVLRSGKVLYMCNPTGVIYHGNGFNTECVGIEINGLFAGVEGDDSTLWNDPSTPYREAAQTVTPAQIEATKQLIRWLVGEVQSHGGAITKLVAHRQSSEDRRDDPGSKVWKEIALPMKAELQLDDGGPGFKINSGYPIPESWDPSRKGIKY